MKAVAVARAYFAVQAGAGLIWWIAVFASDDVRTGTLGGWDPGIIVIPDMVLFVAASALTAATGNRVLATVVAFWTTAVTIALVVDALVERVAGIGAVAMTVATIGTGAAASTIWFGRFPTEWFFVGPFNFRVAKEATDARHLCRSLAQLVVFWTTFFVVVPAVLIAIEYRLHMDGSPLRHDIFTVLGVGMFGVGSVIGLWSCVTMAVAGKGTPLPAETARELVLSGPYRYVRNPMATAGVLQVVGVGVWFGSWTVVAIGIAGAYVWNVMIRPVEEADLARRFGAAYQAYCARVRCWVPRLRSSR